MQKPMTPTSSWPDRAATSSTAPLMSLPARSSSRAIISLPASSGSPTCFAVVEVRCECHEALGGEPVAHVLYVVDEAPPLLDHDDSWAGPARRRGEIALVGRTVARKLDHRSHDSEATRPVSGSRRAESAGTNEELRRRRGIPLGREPPPASSSPLGPHSCVETRRARSTRRRPRAPQHLPSSCSFSNAAYAGYPHTGTTGITGGRRRALPSARLRAPRGSGRERLHEHDALRRPRPLALLRTPSHSHSSTNAAKPRTSPRSPGEDPTTRTDEAAGARAPHGRFRPASDHDRRIVGDTCETSLNGPPAARRWDPRRAHRRPGARPDRDRVRRARSRQPTRAARP